MKIVEIKDNTIETLRNAERNLSQVSWEKEETEKYYSRSPQRCLAEHTTLQREAKEVSIAEHLRMASENNTFIHWEKR